MSPSSARRPSAAGPRQADPLRPAQRTFLVVARTASVVAGHCVDISRLAAEPTPLRCVVRVCTSVTTAAFPLPADHAASGTHQRRCLSSSIERRRRRRLVAVAGAGQGPVSPWAGPEGRVGPVRLPAESIRVPASAATGAAGIGGGGSGAVVG